MTLVSVDANSGTLNRYECGGEMFRRTHGCTLGQAYTFNAKQVESFRVWPDQAFAVEPPPRPTNPPASSGEIRIAA